jgi:hypothetical protein
VAVSGVLRSNAWIIPIFCAHIRNSPSIILSRSSMKITATTVQLLHENMTIKRKGRYNGMMGSVFVFKSNNFTIRWGMFAHAMMNTFNQQTNTFRCWLCHFFYHNCKKYIKRVIIQMMLLLRMRGWSRKLNSHTHGASNVFGISNFSPWVCYWKNLYCNNNNVALRVVLDGGLSERKKWKTTKMI